jgi:hypothetical protein
VTKPWLIIASSVAIDAPPAPGRTLGGRVEPCAMARVEREPRDVELDEMVRLDDRDERGRVGERRRPLIGALNEPGARARGGVRPRRSRRRGTCRRSQERCGDRLGARCARGRCLGVERRDRSTTRMAPLPSRRAALRVRWVAAMRVEARALDGVRSCSATPPPAPLVVKTIVPSDVMTAPTEPRRR